MVTRKDVAMLKPLHHCSNAELTAIIQNNDPDRGRALTEMGTRCASEYIARERAKDDRHYVAREGRDGRWYVWDCVSDHRVEFN